MTQDEARRELAETFANIDTIRARVAKRLAANPPVCEPMVPYYHLPDTIEDDDPPSRSVRFVAAPPEDAAYDW